MLRLSLKKIEWEDAREQDILILLNDSMTLLDFVRIYRGPEEFGVPMYIDGVSQRCGYRQYPPGEYNHWYSNKDNYHVHVIVDILEGDIDESSQWENMEFLSDIRQEEGIATFHMMLKMCCSDDLIVGDFILSQSRTSIVSIRDIGVYPRGYLEITYGDRESGVSAADEILMVRLELGG
jgi:capsid portal protein